jgi:hypothetical protein
MKTHADEKRYSIETFKILVAQFQMFKHSDVSFIFESEIVNGVLFSLLNAFSFNLMFIATILNTQMF